MPHTVGSRFTVVVIAIALGGLLAGCSTGSASPSVAPPSSAASAAASGSVAVELTEWKVTPAAATAPAGPVTFAVTNKGTTIHEFVVVKTDTKAGALPVVDNKIDESKLTAVDEIENIAVGASPTLSVNLEAGHYVLLCNIETHYQQGMGADFDVE